MVSPAYITAISNSHVYPLFMDFYLRRDEPIIQMDNLSQGVTDFRKRLYWDSFIDITCKLPSLLEQERISDFFHAFNNTITLHKRKLDGLRELKKGYLQQMFPQAGEREPRVRFAGFSGEWQERKLGELFKERNERSSEGELISVTINSGVIKASELERKDNSSEDKSNYKKVEVGDIAYNSMRMWQGASGISNYAGILSPAYTVIIPNEGVDSLFISYMFKLTRMIEIFQSFSQGLTSDTWNLKFPLLKEIYVTVPCSNEQAAISDFFRIIDEQITAQAIKLEQLGLLKAAYLQRMFI
jgi:type I restriction enzyme S subunit